MMSTNDRPEKIVKPLRPSDVDKRKVEAIPDAMIQAVNNLILKEWDGYSSSVKQKDIITEYLKVQGKKNTERNRNKVYKENIMDIEPVFEQAGWKVDYDRPGYNENYYDAYFQFTKRKK